MAKMSTKKTIHLLLQYINKYWYYVVTVLFLAIVSSETIFSFLLTTTS